jgi:hypothetical protein
VAYGDTPQPPTPAGCLQFVDKEERVLLRRDTARVEVRSLVAGEFLEEALADCPEEPLNRTLVVANPNPRGLNGYAHLSADAGQLFAHIDFSVVDHDGVGNDRRCGCGRTGRIEGLAFYQY